MCNSSLFCLSLFVSLALQLAQLEQPNDVSAKVIIQASHPREKEFAAITYLAFHSRTQGTFLDESQPSIYIGFKCLITWGISCIYYPYTIVIRVLSATSTTTGISFPQSYLSPTNYHLPTHYYRSFYASFLTTTCECLSSKPPLPTTLHISHCHHKSSIPTGSQITTGYQPQLCCALETFVTLSLTTSQVPGEAIIRIQGLAH